MSTNTLTSEQEELQVARQLLAEQAKELEIRAYQAKGIAWQGIFEYEGTKYYFAAPRIQFGREIIETADISKNPESHAELIKMLIGSSILHTLPPLNTLKDNNNIIGKHDDKYRVRHI